MIGHWTLRGYGPYAVEIKENQKVAGPVGFWFPNDWPEPEIKWGLARDYWGKGYASEATRAVQAIAREHMPEVSLIRMIDDENVASQQLAVAVGATFEKRQMLKGSTHRLYRHPR